MRHAFVPLAPVSRRTVLGWALAAAAAGAASAQEAQQRILVFGDSQAQGLAAALQRAFRGDRQHRVLDRSKISTGINPRSSYDWPLHARELAAGEHASVAVAMFGANDRPTVRSNGEVNPEAVQRFTESYGDRVAEVADAFRQAKVLLIWVGHPLVRDPQFDEDVGLLNDIYGTRATDSGAEFVATSDMFRGPDGGFSAYGTGRDGQTTRLRADDGVHMSPAGYDLIAARLLPLINGERPPPAPGPSAARQRSQG